MSGRPRRRRRILAAWGVLAAIVVAVPPLAVELLYRYGLRQLGPPPSPPSPSASSPLAATAFWLQAGGVMPPSVERMTVDAAAVACFGKPPQELAPDQVALLAALTGRYAAARAESASRIPAQPPPRRYAA